MRTIDYQENERYIKAEIERIKAGETMRMHCVMGVAERTALALCLGEIPEDRAHRGLDTCSAECQAVKRRLQRWEKSKGKCRACGHGLSKKEREELKKVRSNE